MRDSDSDMLKATRKLLEAIRPALDQESRALAEHQATHIRSKHELIRRYHKLYEYQDTLNRKLSTEPLDIWLHERFEEAKLAIVESLTEKIGIGERQQYRAFAEQQLYAIEVWWKFVSNIPTEHVHSVLDAARLCRLIENVHFNLERIRRAPEVSPLRFDEDK